MRLLLLGLALLVGDVIAQAQFAIDKEKDLLYDVSDLPQIQRFKRDKLFQIPFGARLPGNEIPTAAYSYTVRHEPQNIMRNQKNTQQNDNMLSSFPEIETVRSSSNVTDGSSFLKNSVKTPDPFFNNEQVLPENSFLAPDLSFEKASSQQISKPHKDHFKLNDELSLLPPSVKSNEANNPVGSYLPPNLSPKEAIDVPESSYLPPLSSAKNVNIPPTDAYLPPDPTPKETIDIPEGSYLPPDPTPKETIDIPEGSYLPPDPIPKETIDIPEGSYLPPNPTPKEIVEVPESSYLPPPSDLKNTVITPKDEFLPPDLIPEISIELPTGSYLPPESNPKTTIDTLANSYLAPDPTPKETLDILDGSYLPPREQVTIPDESYLPPIPNPKNVIETPIGSYLPPAFTPREPVAVPEGSYLPPILEPPKTVVVTTPELQPVRDMDQFSRSRVKSSVPVKIHKQPQHLIGSEIRKKVIRRPILSTRFTEKPTRVAVYKKRVTTERCTQCKQNDECDSTEICHNEKCVDGCIILRNICVGNAQCVTERHIPACVCPPTFVSQTTFEGNKMRYDCMAMPMPMNNHINNRQLRHTTRDVSRFARFVRLPPSAPLLPSTSFTSFHRAPVRAVSSVRQTFTRNRGACDECGENTYCDVGQSNKIYCKCNEGYIPNEDTINGCKLPCVRDSECSDEYRCQSNKCVPVCGAGACGHGADCRPVNHQPQCECPPGYEGNPDVECRPIEISLRQVQDLPIDLCIPFPCGEDAECVPGADRPVCSCPRGYIGDPLDKCNKAECIEHSDCPGHLACKGTRCYDPCSDSCGSGADCVVENNRPICSCPKGYYGDPLLRCQPITERVLCNPTPCGRNTDCRAAFKNGELRAVCSCSGNMIGDPLDGCRAECVRGRDCPSNQECRDGRCRNACYKGVCGENAMCDVVNNRAECSCPEHAKGDPYSRCYYECTKHEQCSRSQACSDKFVCIDPCEGACGRGADCRVKNHAAICSCPRGYTGDPFVSCREFTLDDLCASEPCGRKATCTPGKDREGNDRPVCTCPHGYIGNPLLSCRKGECLVDSECPFDEVCYKFKCQTPCVYEKGSVCGEGARCKVEDRKPVCSCPQGYEGNPLEACRIAPNARTAGSISSQRRLAFSSSGSRYYY